MSIADERDYRVAEDQEIRPAAYPFDRVAGGRIARVKMRSRARCQVAARGEAHDADAAGIDAIVRRFGANRADGPLRVAKFDRVMILGPEPVLQHERRDSDRVQPPRDIGSLFLHCEVLVAAAGTHHHRRTRSPALRHDEGINHRLIGGLGTLCAGGAIRPEQVAFLEAPEAAPTGRWR